MSHRICILSSLGREFYKRLSGFVGLHHCLSFLGFFLIFCLVVLFIFGSGLWKSPTITVEFCISHFNYVRFCLIDFGTLGYIYVYH